MWNENKKNKIRIHLKGFPSSERQWKLWNVTIFRVEHWQSLVNGWAWIWVTYTVDISLSPFRMANYYDLLVMYEILLTLISWTYGKVLFVFDIHFHGINNKVETLSTHRTFCFPTFTVESYENAKQREKSKLKIIKKLSFLSWPISLKWIFLYIKFLITMILLVKTNGFGCFIIP